jgi:hypothetical protein
MAPLASKLKRDVSWSAIAAAAWDAPGWKAAAIKYRADHPAQTPSVEPESPRHPSWYCETCGSRPCANPTFCRACRAADKRVSPPSEQTKRLRRLMDDNVDALVYSLRSGVDALRDRNTLRRLVRLDRAQVRQAAERVRNFKRNIAPAWDLDAVEVLFEIWIRHHGR